MRVSVTNANTVLITVLYFLWEIKDEKNIEMTDKFQSKLFKRSDKSKNRPCPLTEERLMALYHHTSEEKHLEMVKKMILLQCFIGMLYDDIKEYDPKTFEIIF